VATFLDYESGKSSGRYVDASLPLLPFDAGQFELPVCSHFLFLYSAQFDEAFHLASIHELLRVAHEVRIFPVLALGATRSAHVDPVVAALRASGLDADIVRVPYEFQRGGNEMLCVSRQR
jgi:hypothetical protein